MERLDLWRTLGISGAPADRLMIPLVVAARRRHDLGGGRDNDPLQPPLVDVIVPAGQTQESVLKEYDIQAKRPVRLEAVVPAAAAASATRPTR